VGDHPLVRYHERTKHSYQSVRRPGLGLDWANEPPRFKEYEGAETLPLPEPLPTEVPCHTAILKSARCDGEAELDVESLSHLLFHAAGVIREVHGPGGSFHFRTYAAAGALYPVEAYVVCGEAVGVRAGVYHYAPRHHALHRLRTGDARGRIGLAGEPPGSAALILTGLPWRTAWKYGARGFRHLYWDAGMILANLLAAAAALEVSARVLLGFVDRSVEELLGLDGDAEFPLVVVALGHERHAPAGEPAPLEAREVEVAVRRRREPMIEAVRRSVILETDAAVQSFLQPGDRPAGREKPPGMAEESAVVEAEPLAARPLSSDAFEEVVRRRGSSRRLAREPFPAGEFAALLDPALAGMPTDWTSVGTEVHLVANALEGLEPGTYRYLGGGRFALIRAGSFRREAGYLCLEQRLGADAAVTSFLLADVETATGTLGGRGYAAAQLEAAVAAGRMYLGAYAQCLGASGITFYDDEVRAFLETDLEPMMAVVMGPEGHRRGIQRCREAKARNVSGT
jgi:SagB-type dehydrogenase family enzyme